MANQAHPGGPQGMTKLTSLSVAIPVYNESAVLPELIERLRYVLDRLRDVDVQVVFVDDGSTDDTPDQLEAIVFSDPRFEAILLSRNFGHQAALTAALDHVTGEATVVMDADLQDDPAHIPDMIAKYEEGHDVVYAVRRHRQESVALRLAYWGFYRLMTKLSRVAIPTDAGDFGLMSRRVVEAVRMSPERQRYLRGLRAWVGFKQCGLNVERPARAAGRSKYSKLKLLQLAMDGIFAFSLVPLRLATLFGGLAVVVATVWALVVVFAKLALDRSPQGFSSVIITIVFLSGTNLFFLGVIGEYVGRTYEESKGRPQYLVDRVIKDRARQQ
jgi:glycosyltransferase involved in cell wall biosynthesis